MVYIPPSEFITPPSVDSPSDRTCHNCGYNLQGIPMTAACPECGEAQKKYRGVRTKDMPLSQMPESFVRRLALCCVVAVLVFPAVAARLFGPFFQQLSPLAVAIMVDCIIASIWLVGVGALTQPINNPEAIRYGLGATSKLRKTTRWCAFGGFGIVFSKALPLPFVTIPLFISVAVSGIGLLCLFLFLAEVADWARDTRSKKLLEVSAWGAPFVFLISFLLSFIPFAVPFVFVLDILAFVLVLAGILGMLMLTSSVLLSVAHAREYEEYQERRLQSKENTNLPLPK